MEPTPVPANLQLLFLDFLREQPHQEGTVREFSLKTNLSEEKASEIAERLWFDGMICRGGEPRGWGRNAKEDPFETLLTLTPFALEILSDPEGPEKWVTGRVFDPYRPQSRLRAALTGSIHSPVSLVFLALIFAVFAFGLYQCAGAWKTTVGYLQPDDNDPLVGAVYARIGLETGAIWIAGHWWVPLQANLVHLGLLHLIMNSLVLWRLGGHVERVYGSLPYFLICLGSGWLGGCAALAWNPFGGAGASAALSGVIAADGVWYLSNRKMLSRKLHFLWGQQVTINLAFLLAISFMAKVSASGHFGGALAGALVSWCWLGFSTKKQSVPARLSRSLGMLAAVGFSGFFLVETARTHWEIWDLYREYEYFQPLSDRLREEILNPLFRLDWDEVRPLSRTHPALRENNDIEAVIKKLAGLRSMSEEQRLEWQSVPHSVRQNMPEKIQSLFDAIDNYIDLDKSYIQSGLRPDMKSRAQLEAAFERLMEEVKGYFPLTENAADPEQEQQQQQEKENEKAR